MSQCQVLAFILFLSSDLVRLSSAHLHTTQYGGSGAMHKEALSSTTEAAVAVAAATAVENGGVSATKRSGGGGSFLTNAMTSIKRYYNNNFSDHGKQHAMNVFLGHFIPDAVKSNIWELDAGAVRCDADLAYGAAVGSLTRALALAQTQQLRAVRRIVNIDRSRPVAPASKAKAKRTSLSAASLLPQIAEDVDDDNKASDKAAEVGGGSAADATAANADTSTDVSAAKKSAASSAAATRARFLDSHSWLRDEFRDYFEERYAPADLTSFDDELALPHNRVVAVRKVLIGSGSPASGNVAVAMVPTRFSLALASEQSSLASDSDGKNASISTSTSTSTSATSTSSSNVPLTTIAEETGVASPVLSASSSSPSTIPLSSSSSALPALPPLSSFALDGSAYSIFAPRPNGGSSSGASGSKNLLVSNRTAHSSTAAAAAPHSISSSSGISTSAAAYANYIALASSHNETASASPSSTDYSHYCDSFAFAAPIARAALDASASDVALVQYATVAERSLAELPSTLALSSSASSTVSTSSAVAAAASSALQAQRRAEVQQLRDLTRARLARLDSLAAQLDSGSGLGLGSDNILGALGDVDPASSNYFANAAPMIVASPASVVSATAAAASSLSSSSAAAAAPMGRAAAALTATLSLSGPAASSGEPFVVSAPASSSSAGGLGADSMMPLSYFPRHRKSLAPSTPTALPSAPAEPSAAESPAKSGGFFTSLTSLFSKSK
jgi:hypothetical protein